MIKHIATDMILFGVLATSALCAGIAANQFRDKPLRLVYESKENRILTAASRLAKDAVTPAAPAESAAQLPEHISLDEFKQFAESKRGIVLDARPEIFHRLGHVPGALSLPRDDFDNAYSTLKERLEQNKAQPIVIYCSSGSCEDSELVKKGLAALGYNNLSIFKGGWTEWTQAKLPEEANQ